MSAASTGIILFCMSYICMNVNDAVLLTSDKSAIMPNNTVSITINTHINVVDIELSTLVQTPLVWEAFGFGSTVMLGTYTIIVDYSFPGEVPIILESTLGQRSIGTIYTEPEINIISDTNDGITRIIHIQRAINGTYSFPNAPITFDVISAVGQKSNFQRCSGQRQPGCQHISGSGRSIKTLVLEEVILPTSAVTTTLSAEPIASPTKQPTIHPTITPTMQPTPNPTTSPTKTPTANPTVSPTKTTSNMPTANPSVSPTTEPSVEPSVYPTNTPSLSPVRQPTLSPTSSPTNTANPTQSPSKSPTIQPTISPSVHPFATVSPSKSTITPVSHTRNPTIYTTERHTLQPTLSPTIYPTVRPTQQPTFAPTFTENPSVKPTFIVKSSAQPTFSPITSDPFTWVCGEDAKCRHHVISCDDTNGTYCNLHCLSSTSCQYTIFECLSDMQCDILCEGYKACDSLSVIGRKRSHLNVKCNGNSSCTAANINGAHSKLLNITCSGDQSCDDIAFWCPAYTVSESVFRANCKIAAAVSNDVSTVNKMRIYADNSWNDIDETSQLPLGTEVEMFCHSDTSQCVIQQWSESWNCEDTESLCYISEHIETTLLPLYTSSIQPVFTTDSEEEEEVLSSTLIVCDEKNPCDTNIVCNETKCHVMCNADNSCKLNNIRNMKENSILSVECNGYASCEGANVFGRDLLYLSVTCSGFKACKNTNFYGNNSKLLNIKCLDDSGSCQDMNVFCPLDRNGCVISNDGNEGNDVHRNLDLYAIHSFDDLDLSNYDAILLNNSNNITNRMHCGVDYQSFCTLDASLYCDCEYAKEEFLWLHQITVAEIVAISISAAVLISIIGLFAVCVFCPQTKLEPKDEEKTEIEMENRELMGGDASNCNAIAMECDNESDHDSEHEILYEDGNESKSKKHPKHSLYRKV